VKIPRSSGILLHCTSLPGRFGIGDLGPSAYEFADFLAASGQTLWQVLPLNPTGYGDSPYQCFSAFAGNPQLLSLERLRDLGLLKDADLAQPPPFPEDSVDFGAVIEFKRPILLRAAQAFFADASRTDRAAFDRFCENARPWLDDFALFMERPGPHGIREFANEIQAPSAIRLFGSHPSSTSSSTGSSNSSASGKISRPIAGSATSA